QLVEHLGRNHVGVVCAGGQHVDDVERLQGVDDHRGADHGDRRPQQWRDGELHDPELVRAIHAGGLEDFGADCLEAGRDDYHAEPGDAPNADEDQRRVVGGRVDQPGNGLLARQPEQGVEGAGLGCTRRLVVEHELPDDRRGDGADRNRQEDGDLGQGLVADAVEEDRDDESEGDADRGVEDQPQEAVPKRRQSVREGEEVDVVVQPHPGRVRVVAEAQYDGAEKRVDHEDRCETDRRQRPEVGPDPDLQSLRQTLDDSLAQDDVPEQHERNENYRGYRRDELLHPAYLLIRATAAGANRLRPGRSNPLKRSANWFATRPSEPDRDVPAANPGWTESW